MITVNHMILVSIISISLAGCSKIDEFNGEKPIPASLNDVKSKQENRVTQASRIEKAKASISCGYNRDHVLVENTEIVYIKNSVIADAFSRCKKYKGTMQLRLRITYDGEINSSFANLIRLAAHQGHSVGFDVLDLSISSGGGDVDSAIEAGNEMADSRWVVSVPDGGRCLSACVLILAAADMRFINQATVGIHRIIPTVSNARTRSELDAELNEVQAKVKGYLRRQGADVSLADEMMTVPSGEIRVLTNEELQKFGLTGTNSVNQDLTRIDFIRRCGREFVERVEANEREIERECGSVGGNKSFEESYKAYEACGDKIMAKNGLDWLDCEK